MLFKEQKTLLSMQEICLKLSFLCYKLCFFAFVVKSMLVFDGFLLQYVFSVKQKRCKNKVLDTLNQMSSAFCSKTVYLQHSRQM